MQHAWFVSEPCRRWQVAVIVVCTRVSRGRADGPLDTRTSVLVEAGIYNFELQFDVGLIARSVVKPFKNSRMRGLPGSLTNALLLAL